MGQFPLFDAAHRACFRVPAMALCVRLVPVGYGRIGNPVKIRNVPNAVKEMVCANATGNHPGRRASQVIRSQKTGQMS